MVEDLTLEYQKLRDQMVDLQLYPRGITDERVLKTMRQVPRHMFVPDVIRHEAYADKALPIGKNQTISQPYIVAVILQALKIQPTDRVLDVGTGSGYLAALLGQLAAEVYSIELDPELYATADKLIRDLGYKNITCIQGDGRRDLPDLEFAAIAMSAAAEEIPRELLKRLKLGGRMVLPVGDEEQVLVLLEKTESGLKESDLGPVRFVPFR